MALVAGPRKSRLSWLVGYAVLCVVFGLWGAYDYWVRIPQQIALYDSFASIKETKEKLEAKAANPATPLSNAEVESYEHAKTEFLKFSGGTPEPVPFYDAPLQLWVYVVGCGIIGTPWCLVSIGKLRKRLVTLDDSGTLTVDGVSIQASEIESIDMSRWMAKSIATVQGTGGRKLVIDDYMMKDSHFIVGRLAHQAHPELWNEDATKVEAPTDDDGSATEMPANASTDSQEKPGATA